MSLGRKRDWRTLGCAALLGASIAFPAGLVVGGKEAPREKDRDSSRSGSSGADVRTTRNLYSPRVISDPYVIEEQRKVLRSLELSCKQLNKHCAEAEQARRRIEEAEARR